MLPVQSIHGFAGRDAGQRGYSAPACDAGVTAQPCGRRAIPQHPRRDLRADGRHRFPHRPCGRRAHRQHAPYHDAAPQSNRPAPPRAAFIARVRQLSFMALEARGSAGFNGLPFFSAAFAAPLMSKAAEAANRINAFARMVISPCGRCERLVGRNGERVLQVPAPAAFVPGYLQRERSGKANGRALARP